MTKLTTEDVKLRVIKSGYKRDPKDERDYLFRNSSNYQSVLESEGYLTLPTIVDYTSEMSSVKDQGQLGSCVSFAVVALKEWQEQKEHAQEVKEGKKYERNAMYNLSESWVYWNAKKIDPWPNEEGTSIRYAMKVLQKIGVPTEQGWPYHDVDFGDPKRWATLVARWSLIKSYWSISSITELKTALTKSPVPIGIGCFEEMFYVSSNGFVPYPRNPSNCYGGHAICVVGYDDSRKIVKFKNSWSTGWGEQGYGYISYDYIRDFMWDAWTSEDLQVTREMLKGVRTLS